MLKNIPEEERQEKARLLKNRFVVRMAGFWNIELEKDKSDRHMPPIVHYERMIRRLNSNLRAWNRDDVQELRLDQAYQFPIIEINTEVSKTLKAEFQKFGSVDDCIAVGGFDLKKSSTYAIP